MGQIKKVVFIKNAVETLGYFSEQIALEMERLGFDTYFIDYDHMYETLDGLSHFAARGKMALVTFNFIGLGGEDIFLWGNGRYLWEKYEMQYLNILVDHPLYYHAKLEQNLPGMTVFCIDREHVRYMERFYPETAVKFLLLAGNMLPAPLRQERFEKSWNYENSLLPYEARKYNLVFTANYVSFDEFYQRILDMDAEYAAFYRGILNDLIARPKQSVDAVMERHIRAAFGAVSAHDMRTAMAGMVLIDLCVRAYFREKILSELADDGVRIHLFGADWERLRENKALCRNPQNLVIESGQVDSAACVQAVRDARISLNIMPWFKDGAHDRIFTAMLQKTVALTDDSRYLRENFSDGEELVYFLPEERGKLAEQIGGLLEQPENAARIASNGYQRACAIHTWAERAKQLAAELA